MKLITDNTKLCAGDMIHILPNGPPCYKIEAVHGFKYTYSRVSDGEKVGKSRHIVSIYGFVGWYAKTGIQSYKEIFLSRLLK